MSEAPISVPPPARPPSQPYEPARPAEPLRVRIVPRHDRVLVQVRGELDCDTGPDLFVTLAPLADRYVELDFSQVPFMDSTGLNILRSQRRASRRAGGDLCLLRYTPPVRRVLDATRTFDYLTAPCAT
ncbi:MULTISPECIES: STAS domain-containing protein [unclassified Streptomyces]|uniref:STAS domain-containing protein n=1 Tax=unclassified Streptomyces TaxID=2593676 RepID=UPI00382F721E